MARGRPARSRDEFENYVIECEKLTTHDFYAVPRDCGLAGEIGDGDPIILPSDSKQIDFEGEIGVVIGAIRARERRK